MLTRVREEMSPAEASSRHHDMRIFTGVMAAMTFILIAKGIGAAKEIAVAARYGTSAPVDAYLLIFKLYDLPNTVWTGALAVTFVPLFFRLRGLSGELARFQSELTGAGLLAGAGLGLAAAIAVPLLLLHSSFGLSPEVKNLAISMAAPLALMIPLGTIMGITFNRLVAAEKRVVSLLDGVPACVLLVALLLIPYGGSAPLVWGTVVGYAAAVVLLMATQARLEPLPLPVFRFRSPLWREFARASAVVVAAGFVLSVTAVVDQIMVAHLGPAAIATLGYASRILALVTGIGATAISRVILPILSEAEASDSHRAWQLASKWSLLFMGVGAVSIVVGWFLSPFVVQVMFQRGAFTDHDTAAVAEVLRFGLLQLPFYFSAVIVAQLWAARSRYGVFFAVNAAGLAVKVLTNALLVDRLGINGVMIGTAAMYAVCLFVLWFVGRVVWEGSKPIRLGGPVS